YNAFPDLRRANGLYLFECPNNLIVGNRWHHNQDSGQQVQSGSHSVGSIQNVSYANGDHRFDPLYSGGTLAIRDLASGDFKDGFSFEGASSGSSVHDCIAAENGITTNEADLWVDDASISGLSCDDNIFWNSTSQPPIKRGLARFVDVTAWSDSTGMDTRTL